MEVVGLRGPDGYRCGADWQARGDEVRPILGERGLISRAGGFKAPRLFTEGKAVALADVRPGMGRKQRDGSRVGYRECGWDMGLLRVGFSVGCCRYRVCFR